MSHDKIMAKNYASFILWIIIEKLKIIFSKMVDGMIKSKL